MINRTRIMLYVNDVEVISKFWLDIFGAEKVETLDLLEGFQSIVVALSQEVELGLFPKEFVQKYSPEVVGTTPSLMFFSDKFHAIHEQLETAGEIVDNNGVATFNFTDPEGNYFVIAEKK